jgi:hypothetical protein
MGNSMSRIANMSVREFKEAIKKLNEFPESHGYSEAEVNELLKIEAEFKTNNEKSSNNFNAHSNEITKAFENINKGLTILLSATMYQMKHIVINGWYISPTVFSDVDFGTLIEYTKQENVNKFETYIEKHVTKKTAQQIFNKLKNDFPERGNIFTEMNNLFIKEFYYSFINMCYSQTDGICKDKWAVGFFDKDNNDTNFLNIRRKLKFQPNSISQLVSFQLNLERNEINKHESKFTPAEKRTTYNRHMVIHGRSYNYGNKKNAIRALLALEFVHWLTIQNSITKAV